MGLFFLVLLFLSGLGVGLYALLVEPFRLVLTDYRVASRHWTAQAPLRIAVLSDVHAIWPWMTPAHLETIVARTNALKPDLVLLAGDYVATHPFGLAIDPMEGVQPYRALSAPCGVFAVLGNHDLHGSRGWPEALAATGIPVLQNEARAVSCRGRRFWVGGLEDLWWQKADVGKTLAQVTNAEPVILLMHNPDSFPEVPASVALSVAGHTHGGQIRLPFVGALSAVIPSKYGKRYARGAIMEDGRTLVVSSGLGSTGLPLRFLTPPEIVLITLVADEPPL